MNPLCCIKTILILTANIAFSYSANAESFLPSKIVVIKDSKSSLVRSESIDQLLKSSGIDLKIYDMDAVDRFESEINQLIPGDELQAGQVFNEYVKRVGRKAFEQKAINAYQGIMAVVHYDLKKYQAIIFDDSSVIYGVTDMEDALLHYQNWRAVREGER